MRFRGRFNMAARKLAGVGSTVDDPNLSLASARAFSCHTLCFALVTSVREPARRSANMRSLP